LSQLSFFDQPAADRILFAISLEPQIAEIASRVGLRVADLQAWPGRARPTRVLHITLSDLGIFDGLPAHIIDKAIAAGASVSCAPFGVSFDRVGVFRGKQTIMVLQGGEGLQALMTFRAMLVEAMHLTGLTKTMQKGVFTPHVTLQYGRQDLAEQAIEPVAWTVREFSLIHSPQGQTQHIPLATWRLGPG
jgi:2'-5' RNA ligase